MPGPAGTNIYIASVQDRLDGGGLGGKKDRVNNNDEGKDVPKHEGALCRKSSDANAPSLRRPQGRVWRQTRHLVRRARGRARMVVRRDVRVPQAQYLYRKIKPIREEKLEVEDHWASKDGLGSFSVNEKPDGRSSLWTTLGLLDDVDPERRTEARGCGIFGVGRLREFAGLGAAEYPQGDADAIDASLERGRRLSSSERRAREYRVIATALQRAPCSKRASPHDALGACCLSHARHAPDRNSPRNAARTVQRHGDTTSAVRASASEVVQLREREGRRRAGGCIARYRGAIAGGRGLVGLAQGRLPREGADARIARRRGGVVAVLITASQRGKLVRHAAGREERSARRVDC
ncbi:hypothetical protein C8J57DRAFT_1230604 [Mycena rebaudengoi]|nr:hypothetical protein C8J57DRAFT_1230604 [Mycena rebaudengoi]